MTGPRLWAPWALWAASVAGVVGSVVSRGLAEVGWTVMIFAFASVGLVLVLRRPDNSIGWLLAASGAVGGLGGWIEGYSYLASTGALPGADLVTWLTFAYFWPVLGILFIVLPLVFPTGRLLSPRWRWAPWMAAGFVALGMVGNAFYPWPPSEGGPNPYGIEGAEATLTLLQNLAVIPGLLGMGAAVVSLILRYRRAAWTERQQLKWFLLVTLLVPVAVFIGDTNTDTLQPVVVPLTLSLYPVAIGVAVLRHGLYQIDRIVSRTITYTLVVAVLAGVYAGAIFLLRDLLPMEGDLAVAGSTLAVAALFGPVRRRVRRRVERRFNRGRYDAERTLAGFTDRLRHQVDLNELSTDLVSVVHRTLQPARVAVSLQAFREVRR